MQQFSTASADVDADGAGCLPGGVRRGFFARSASAVRVEVSRRWTGDDTGRGPRADPGEWTAGMAECAAAQRNEAAFPSTVSLNRRSGAVIAVCHAPQGRNAAPEPSSRDVRFVVDVTASSVAGMAEADRADVAAWDGSPSTPPREADRRALPPRLRGPGGSR